MDKYICNNPPEIWMHETKPIGVGGGGKGKKKNKELKDIGGKSGV